MKIIDTEIGSVVSLYVVKCDCGNVFKSRTDRWKVTCPSCYECARTRELDNQDDEARDSGDFEDPT
jgi:hypothetical protein